MAVKLISKDWRPCLDDYTYDYIADAEADIASLPQCSTGSSALVVESGAIYMVNASGVWALFGG